MYFCKRRHTSPAVGQLRLDAECLRFWQMVQNHAVEVEFLACNHFLTVWIEAHPLFVDTEVGILPRNEFGDHALLLLQHLAHRRELLLVVAKHFFNVLIYQPIVAFHCRDLVQTTEVPQPRV